MTKMMYMLSLIKNYLSTDAQKNLKDHGQMVYEGKNPYPK